MVPFLCVTLCTVISVAASSSAPTPEEESLGNETSTSPPSTSSSAVSWAVIAVIAVCGSVAAIGLFNYGLCHCYINKDRVTDWDAIQYNIQEEYEAKINFEALDRLDPAVRAGIDMDMLGKMTDTDPKLLEKYRDGDTERRSSSLKGNLLYTSHESLHRHYSQTLQASLKKNSLADDDSTGGTMKRSNTMSDVNSCRLNAVSMPIPAITMKIARSESKGSMFVVESQDTQEFRSPMNLLHVLSVSTNAARPRSMTELSEAEEDLHVSALDADVVSYDSYNKRKGEAVDEIAKWVEAKEEAKLWEPEAAEELERQEDNSRHLIRMIMETPV